jgi:hypothetical protein
MMGLAGLHHFVTIGRFAYLGGAARIHHDVPPFVKVDGADEVRGLNKVGLARAGYSAEDIKALDLAYRKLFSRKRPLSVAIDELESMNGNMNGYVGELVEFLRRRDQGKHGRYLEGRRGGAEPAAALTAAAGADASQPESSSAAGRRGAGEAVAVGAELHAGGNGEAREPETRHVDARHGDTRHGESRHAETRHSETSHSETRHRGNGNIPA